MQPISLARKAPTSPTTRGCGTYFSCGNVSVGSAPGSTVNLSTPMTAWTNAGTSRRPVAFRFVAVVGNAEWPLEEALGYQPHSTVTVALPPVPSLAPPAVVRFAVYVRDAHGAASGPFAAAADTVVGPSGAAPCEGLAVRGFGAYAACVTEHRKTVGGDVVTLLLDAATEAMVNATAWPVEEVCALFRGECRV